MGVLLAAGALCVVFPAAIMGVFIDDPDVIGEGVVFLRYVAPFWAFFGGTMVVQGAFRGAGQTKVAMALSFLSRWVFRVPVAVLLAFTAVTIPGVGVTVAVGPSVGVEGIWAAFSIGAFASFLVAVFWFRLGRWSEGVIEEEHREPGVEEVESVDD
jgi:Na+-driven multidrug efflux pump